MELSVNGRRWVVDAEPDTPLLTVLRNDLGLSGAKRGCAQEQCYACCVLVDGRAQPSCQLPVGHVGDLPVTTVEGVDGLQDFFLEEQAGQCGFCIAGMIVAAQGLLNQTRYPSDAQIREALDTNLCRCGVYDRIRRAIRYRIGQPDDDRTWRVHVQPPLATTAHPLTSSAMAHPELDDWLSISDDGMITLFTGKAELGQGIRTALVQIAAEELAVSAERIRVVAADTARTPDEGHTAGSMSIETSGVAIRSAAATACRVLLGLAATHLGVAEQQLVVDDGTISDPEGSGTVTYWELHGGRHFHRRLTDPVETAGLRLQRSAGCAPEVVARVDLPGKVSGQPSYVHDLVLPEMTHARVLRPPAYGARLIEVDDSVVRAMPGVLAVVRNGSFVGVIAKRQDQADRAHAALCSAAEWRNDTQLPDPIDDLLTATTRNYGVVDGDPVDLSEFPPAEAHEPNDVTATYTKPLTMHASIGPSAAIAHVVDGRLMIWSHTQGAFFLRDAVAEALDMDPADVRVIHAEGAGCYGHNGADDVALDAALLAAASGGRPVKVMWSRSDEHRWEPYGSPMVVQIRASLDADGQVESYESEIWSAPHVTRPTVGGDGTSGLLAAWHLREPMVPRSADVGGRHTVGAHRNADPAYSFARRRILAHVATETPFRTSALRALGAYANVFALESFMDELAHAAGVDPVEYRLRQLEDVRGAAVIGAAAEAASWGSPVSCFGPGDDAEGLALGRGVAFAQYKNRAAYLAAVVELGVDPTSGSIRIGRAVLAVDAGRIVHPDGVSNQLEGGCVQSASWTLKESVRVNPDGVASDDWDTYPILRFSESFPVCSVLLDRPEQRSLGCGEAAQGPTAAAIANAVYDAVGVRFRDIPFTSDRVLAGLGCSSGSTRAGANPNP